MKLPQIIILELDGWLAKQLRELAGESRWLVQPTRSVGAALSLARVRRPAVLLVQVELGEDKPASLQLVADVHRQAPDVPIVVVSDVKFPDAERAAWTSALLDLGARYVLFPPLMKSILEDVVSGLMNAAIRTVVGEAPPREPRKRSDIIDLALGDSEA
jgi:ActR/RegA family two-component response regulator